jgi:parallel beta-helix repeat protein
LRDNIIIDGAGYTLQGTGSIVQGIRLAGRTNVTVQNIQIKTFQNGIVISDYSSNITISRNTITNTNNGLWVRYSSSNSISGNNIANNSYGIRLEYSSSNSISGNTITNERGVYFYNSSSNSVSGNDITNTHYGIWLESYSNFNSISENNVIANTNSGIVLSGSSNNNTISGNNIANNGEGISLTYSSVSSNRIYHNNFMDNTQQAYSLGIGNSWDDGYPSGGNYWSGYEDKYPNATELDNSGLWDAPYVINENNIDYYPLMAPTKPITRKFTAYDNIKVEICSNSSVSEFQFSTTSKTLSFNVTGPAGARGFCNITIPENLLWGDFSLFINGIPLTEGVNHTKTYNGTHYTFHITYTHSEHIIEIVGTEVIPEFPSAIIIPLLMTLTTLAVAVSKRRKAKI